MSATPSEANSGYGFMNYFLNVPNDEGQKRYPSAPSTAYAHIGNGTNMVYVDRENDLVVVARWIPGRDIDELLSLIIGSIERAADSGR